jgi:glycosyltransferase involved in cell wall biosynthesis
MKILFLSNKLPHAGIIGGQRIIYQRIRYLAEAGHQVGLASFISPNVTDEQIQTVKPMLSGLHVFPEPRRNLAVRILNDYLSPQRPALFWKQYSEKMMRGVGDLVEQENYDIVVAEFSEMGQYLYKNPFLSAVHRVISCHRCLTTSFEQYNRLSGVEWWLYMKSVPQARLLQRYEFNMYRSADRVLVLTPQDRYTLQSYAQDLAISVVPAGVDIAHLQEHPPIPKEPIILHTGYMGDPANDDGVEWFYQNVWPRLRDRHPEIRFYVVGADPSRRIRKIGRTDPGVIVTGEVKDLRPYRNRARVFVSPARLGSGVRTKTLEAMVSGLPVVSTSLGMAGIQAQTGFNCLVADTPDLFAQSVEWLLEDRSLGARIARNARALIQQKHSLESGVRRFEQILKSIVGG